MADEGLNKLHPLASTNSNCLLEKPTKRHGITSVFMAVLPETKSGGRLYPMLVERIVRNELDSVDSITSRKSPHVLRHTLATDLLDSGSDINSIKELLGHSSLAATQIYTHNSIERLQSVYQKAHPRAKMDQDCNSDKNSTEQ